MVFILLVVEEFENCCTWLLRSWATHFFFLVGIGVVCVRNVELCYKF